MFLPCKRKIEAAHGAFCRSCSVNIPKGTDSISWYSSANRGMSIHICLDCIEKIHNLVQSDAKLENKENKENKEK